MSAAAAWTATAKRSACQTDEAKQHWEPVVEGFGKAFTNDQGLQEGMVGRAQALRHRRGPAKPRHRRPRQRPDGLYGEYEILQHGDTQIAARMT